MDLKKETKVNCFNCNQPTELSLLKKGELGYFYCTNCVKKPNVMENKDNKFPE